MKKEIIPSILVEDLDEFIERIEICEDFAEIVQWDIMDGQFVEEMTFSEISALDKVGTGLHVEAHLMVEHPEEFFEDLVKAGVERVIVHAESSDELTELMEKMKQYDFERGVAINPETSVQDIAEVVDDLDEVLVMTVVPGAGGQVFMEDQLSKISELRQSYPTLSIGVDGGINSETAKKAKEAGANRFYVNSAIFTNPDPSNAYEVLQTIVENGG